MAQQDELEFQDDAGGYENQRKYVAKVTPVADARQNEIERNLRVAFKRHIESRTIDVIVFEKMGAEDLAEALRGYPSILKPLLAACNLAGRALLRDLKLKNIDTYRPRLSHAQASAVAGYLLSFLPEFIELPALSRIDRLAFIDKEIRKDKGRWEQLICAALSHYGKSSFKKRKFVAAGQEFEVDGASPETGPIQIAVDIKRIEARADIHKRCDEIVNKAAKLKSAFPQAKFGAVIYYPFLQDHPNVQARLKSPQIDGIVFASTSSTTIENAVRLLLAALENK